jgi:hypothetical protein
VADIPTTNLVLWLKADAITSLSDGDPVETWPDSSGLSHNAGQGNSSQRPLYKTGILNGNPTVRFDGTDDEMIVGSDIISSSNPRVILVVFNHDSSVSGFSHFLCGRGEGYGDNLAWFALWCTNGSDPGICVWSDDLVGPANSSDFRTAMAKYDGTDTTLEVNGSVIATKTQSLSTGYGWNHQFRIGAGPSWTNSYLKGDIAEIIVYDAVDEDDIADVYTYLNAKYFIEPIVVASPAASIEIGAETPSLFLGKIAFCPRSEIIVTPYNTGPEILRVDAVGIVINPYAPVWSALKIASVPLAGIVCSSHTPGILGQVSLGTASIVVTTLLPPWEWRLPVNEQVGASIIYECTLTGSEEDPAVDDLVLPISSLSARQSSATQSYLSVVVSNIATYGDAIAARPNGQIIVKRGYRLRDGRKVLQEFARANFNDLRLDYGPRNQSVSLSGYRTRPAQAATNRTLSSASYKSVDHDGKKRFRTAVDNFLAPGDTAIVDGESIIVSEISYTISPSYETMEVVEA